MFISSAKLYLIPIMLLIALNTVLAQNEELEWVWQNPMPNGNDLHGVQMLDENNIIVVGGAGLVMRTSNAGSYWGMDYKVADIYWKFNDVFFVDENTGWAVGEGDVHDDILVIAKTTDGGITWTRQNVSNVQHHIPNSVFFVNADIGYVVGEAGMFLSTTNGGLNWVEKTVWGGIVSPINDVYFITSQIGWVVSQSAEIGLALKTTDAGQTWELEFAVQFTLFRTLFMVDNQFGYLGGMGVYKTTNGGTSWNMTPASPSGSIRDMHFFNANVGLTVGADYIWRTTNGGETWTMVYPGQVNTELFSVSFIDELNGFVSGARGMVLRTTDGGITWNELTNIYINIVRLDDIHFVNRQIGIVVGDDGGKIFRTNNGGVSWDLIEAGITTVLRAVDFFDENTGVAVGRYGIIRRTTNAGESWTNPQVNQATEQLFGLHIFDQTFACAVGENTIVTTTDAGQSWYKQTYTYPDWVMGVHFVTRQKGFAVGVNGKIYKTTDEGATWIQAATIVPQNILRRVAFANELNGVAVGDLGTIARTTDGGDTWTRVQLSEDYINSFFAISFVNETDGYAAGDGGMILKTMDAGATWIRQASPTMHRILGMHFMSEDQAAISGAFGQIILTSNLAAPDFSTNKNQITFLNVPAGTTRTDSLTVYNSGNGILEILNIETTNSYFSITPTSATVLANDSAIFIVQVSADSVGSQEGELIFNHNGTSSPDTVNLSAVIVTNMENGIQEEFLPRSIVLHQNYPNPFNPSTMIRFDIPQSSHVTITVFNMMGQKVDVLLDKEMQAGYHSIEWNAEHLSSGIYFYQLSSGRNSLVRKGILLR